MKMRYTISLLIIIFSFQCFSQKAQWRGEKRDGHYPETGLLKAWPEEGPPLLFKTEGIGTGWSSAVEYQGTIYVTGMKKKEDVLSAIDREGKIIWQVPYGRSWTRSFPDTRCTPAVTDDKAFVISGSGEVACIDASTGRIIWKVPAFEKFSGNAATWGTAESPLVFDGKVIYTPGGNQTMMVALDAENGETVWKTESLNDSTAYASPIVFDYMGRKVIAGVSAHYIYGVDAGNGTILWKIRYADIRTPTWDVNAPVINCNSPVYRDGKLYVTSGYNHVGVQLKLPETGGDPEVIWTDSVLDTHLGGVVLLDGYLYGANWLSNSNGDWCCINWETGKSMYEAGWISKGSVITDGKMLYCYEERRGNVALVANDTTGFRIISSFRVSGGSGPYWAHPSIYARKLLLRHGDVLFAYDIADKGTGDGPGMQDGKYPGTAGTGTKVEIDPQRQWSMFRGYRARGFLDGASLPGRWNVEKNEHVLWKTEVIGLGLSSPVIWGERLFITTAVSEGEEGELKTGIYGSVDPVEDESVHHWMVMCYDRLTGELLWERTACTGIPKVKRHPKSTHANATVATDGRYVVAFFGSEGLYCYNMEGEMQWKKDLGLLRSAFFVARDAEWEWASSPIIHDGVVVVQADVLENSFVAAYEVANGNQLWREERDEYPGWCTPNIYYDGDRCLVAVNGYKHRGGYDFMTGEEVWKMSGGGDIPIPTPVAAGDLVYFNSAHGKQSPILAVQANARGELNMGDGEFSGDYIRWGRSRGGSYMQTMLVYRGLLYNVRWNGSVACLDAATGEELWREKAGSGNSYVSSPVASDGRIYITDDQGTVYVLEAGKQYRLLAENHLGDVCMATPAISERTIYFRTMKYLLAIGGN